MTEAEKRYTIEKVFKTSGCSPNPETIDQMVKLAREVHFPAGAAIQEIGVEQKYLYLITEGIARSYYIDSEGNDITKMFSLEVFEALENLKSLRFEAKKMKEIIYSDKAALVSYAGMLEQTVIYKMRREYSLQNMQAMERYLQFREDYRDLLERVPQNVIASYLGIKKESISRLRRNLRDNG